MPTAMRPLLLLVAILALLAACNAQGPEPATTPAPAEETVEQVAETPQLVTATPEPQVDDWSRVRQAGKLLVGTSADYPPFAYYNKNFAMDGFDIALIREIGARLGVDVEIKDFAFDGLLGAVELGQIDVAIAAISITPERDEFVDFSHPYYVGEEAILTSAGSSITQVAAATDLGDKRIGVQRGSVYESWVVANLILTELMPESNLLSFGDIEQAVRSLEEGRVDLVLMDNLPAQRYVRQSGIKQVAHGISRQQFGMAVRNGSTLQGELNRILGQLQDEDVVAQLASQYLQLQPEEIIPPTPEPEPPTATPAPTPTLEPQATPVPPPTPTPEPRCIDGMQWVQDLSYDDRNMTAPPLVAAGLSFAKGWRVLNSGTCPWDGSYALTYLSGNSPASQMGGRPLAVQGLVPAGATYDLWLNLAAPQSPGVYQGFWQMHNGEGVPFGERIWVGITVPGQPTPTPFPTPTRAPGIYFAADRTQIRAGEPVNFTWRVFNVQAVYFYADGQPWQQNGVAGDSSRTVYPQQTTTYNLRVVHPDDRVEVRQITVYVQRVANAPVINQFTVQPGQIRAGQCVDIAWDVWGDLSDVKLSFNDIIIWDGAPVRSSIDHCPPISGTLDYRLEAFGPGGTSRQQRTVQVQ